MKRIRFLRDAGLPININTASGGFVVQIVSTRHGWGRDDPNSYCISASQGARRPTWQLSPSRQTRKEAVFDWNDGFVVTAPTDTGDVPGELLDALVSSGNAAFFEASIPAT